MQHDCCIPFSLAYSEGSYVLFMCITFHTSRTGYNKHTFSFHRGLHEINGKLLEVMGLK